MAPPFADLLIRSTLLIGLAWVAVWLLKRQGASAAMRHIVWLCALVGLLLLPLLATTLPKLELPILSETAAPATVPAATPTILAAQPAAAAIATTPEAAAPVVPQPARQSVPLWPLYLIVAAVLLARFGGARLTLARLWRDADPADEGWVRLADSAAATLRMRGGVALRIARKPLMPMTWGTLSPRILLPAEARGWSEARRRLVLLHELAHVRRRDSLTQSVGWLACALYWLHPGAWLAARQMRLEQEVAADDLAIGAGTAPRLYAENLLELAGTLALPAPAMARVSELERRLVAIVGRTSRRAPGPAFAAAAAIGAVASTWIAATALPVHALHAAAPGSAIAAAPLSDVTAPTPASAAPVTPAAATAPATPATPATAVPVAAAALPATAQPVAPVADDELSRIGAQIDRIGAQDVALRRQAVALEAEAGRLERQARAQGNETLAHFLAIRRDAYRNQIMTYDNRRMVLDEQRDVHAYNADLAARRPEDMAQQAEAKVNGDPIPPLEPFRPVPPLPPVPAIPAIPPEAYTPT